MSTVTAVPIPPVKSSIKIWLWLGVILAIAGAFGLAWAGTRAVIAAKGTNEQYLAWNATQPGVHSTASGLQYMVLAPGEGPTPTETDFPTIEVEGKFRDGTVFQPKVTSPFPMASKAMPGFLEALKLMRPGARYRIWLPSKLAYDTMPGGAPPEFKDKIVVFNVTLKEIVSQQEMQMRMYQQQMQQQMQQQQMQGGAPEGAGPEGAAPEGKPEAAPKK